MLEVIALIAVLFLCTLIATLFLGLGWAKVKVKKLAHVQESDGSIKAVYEEGVRFYRPHPYLLVTVNSTTGPQTTLLWLPNTADEYVIRTEGWWGSAKMEATLESGWNLAKIGTASDSKGPETIAAIAGFLGNLKGPAGETLAKPTFVLDPGLYRLLFDENTGFVNGTEKVDLNSKQQSGS